jgi:hypothetical protein
MSHSFTIRRLLGALLATSLLLVLAAAVSACGSSGAASAWGDTVAGDGATQTDGKPAPDFSGVTLDKKTVTLDQFRGKPLLLVYMTST